MFEDFSRQRDVDAQEERVGNAVAHGPRSADFAPGGDYSRPCRSAVAPVARTGSEAPGSLLTSLAGLSTRRPGSLAAPGVLLPNTKA